MFIQQEASLRREGLSNYIHATVHSSNHHTEYRNTPLQGGVLEHQHGTQGHTYSQCKCHNYPRMDGHTHSNVDDSLANCYTRDGTVLSYLNSQDECCPSSWHANGDRHSPVLPNNHVTQKSTYRERQHRVAEYRRKQSLEQNRSLMTPFEHSDYGTSNPRTCYELLHGVHSVTTQYNCRPHPYRFNNFVDTSFSSGGPHTGYVDNSCYTYPSLCQSSSLVKQVRNPAGTDMYLPSPQKLPRLYSSFACKMQEMYKLAETTNSGDSTGYDCESSPSSSKLQNLYSNANLRFSMECNKGDGFEKRLLQQDSIQYSPHLSEATGNHTEQAMLAVKSEHKHKHDTQNCCALSEGFPPTLKHSVKYDIQASVYMRIVEPHTQDSIQNGLELPVFG